jgi:hypothetical protein
MRHLYGRKPLEFDFALPTPHNQKPRRLRRIVVLAVIVAAAVITILSMACHVNNSSASIGRDEKCGMFSQRE